MSDPEDLGEAIKRFEETGSSGLPPPTKNIYTRIEKHEFAIPPCACCGAAGELWEYVAKLGGAAQKVVMCSSGNGKESLEEDCPLVMPPDSYYCATKREAVEHWTKWRAPQLSPAEPIDLEWKLPCDVRLPNGMTIGRGVNLHTLLVALLRRQIYAGEGAEEMLHFDWQQEAERAANARRYKWLLEQTGYFHDGSETTVTLLSDDATRTRSIKVGERYYGVDARSFNAIIDAAIADQRPLNPSSGCAGGSSV